MKVKERLKNCFRRKNGRTNVTHDCASFCYKGGWEKKRLLILESTPPSPPTEHPQSNTLLMVYHWLSLGRQIDHWHLTRSEDRAGGMDASTFMPWIPRVALWSGRRVCLLVGISHWHFWDNETSCHQLSFKCFRRKVLCNYISVHLRSF